MFGKNNNSDTGSLILFSEQLGGQKNFFSWFENLRKQRLLSSNTKIKLLKFNEIKDLSKPTLVSIAKNYSKDISYDLCVITVDLKNNQVEFVFMKFSDFPDPFAAGMEMMK